MAKGKSRKHEEQMRFVDEFSWKQSHGGKRDGAGRKATGIKTKVLRVPEALVPTFKEQIEEYKQSLSANED
ncbi:TPA: hypothetical protein NGS68_000541 [Vibrio parahaemolyticus]|nr:hypothetical protein [Vibrio parahaemolyticus]HCG6655995.1 hypothetical protein [Vibrio parahaemolyticus]HCG6660035.1 hypothetical protein [Vibrio parahaemolyticus]